MLKVRVGKMLKALNADLYEREVAIQLALLTTLAGESVFLLGKPGVAKSLIARRLKDLFKEGEAFEYLMNRFSTPDEIFGPIAISKLKDEDKYERKTEKYLPTANVVFLDEIWKAGPSIQNALLTVINEKIYRNGTEDIKIPLKVLIAASNELPAKNEGLGALWDRFIVRYTVNAISNDANFENYLTKSNSKSFKIAENIKITNKEYLQWKKDIEKVTVSKVALNIVNAIRYYIKTYNSTNETKIYVSDRRWKKIIHLLKTSAFFNEREAINVMDCTLIVHAIWDNEMQINTVNDFVVDAIKLHSYDAVFDYKNIEEEFKIFKKDVDKAVKIKVTETYLKPIEVEGYNEKFYELELPVNTNGYSSYKYILTSDFNALSTKSYMNISIHDSTRSYSNSKNFEAKTSESNALLIRANHSKVKGSKINFVSEEKTRIVDGQQMPNNSNLIKLNKKAKVLLGAVETQYNSIAAERNTLDNSLGKHLFIPSKFNSLATQQLYNILNSFIILKASIQKIKDSYESL